MVANDSKFQALIIYKNKQGTSGLKLKINGETIKTSKEGFLLGVTIGNKLSVCIFLEFAGKQEIPLNGIKRLHEYFSEKEKKVLVKTYVLSYFNYCTLVWHFCGKGSLHKMEEVQERAIRFIKNTLRDLGEVTLYLKRVRLIAQEVFKSFKGQNPEYIQNLLGKRHATQPMSGNERPLQRYVPRVNQITSGYRSYTHEAPTLWNSLPIEYRKAESYEQFRNLIRVWDGPSCRCNISKYGNKKNGIGTDSSFIH